MTQLKCVYHGGKCCGIKTIYDFGYGPLAPEGIQDAIDAVNDGAPSCLDTNFDEVSSDTPFFLGEAPQETALERLDRFLLYLQKWRPVGIVEATLSESKDPYWNQIPVWEQILLDRGFKEVNKHKNSNTDNTVHVYHLNEGE